MRKTRFFWLFAEMRDAGEGLPRNTALYLFHLIFFLNIHSSGIVSGEQSRPKKQI